MNISLKGSFKVKNLCRACLSDGNNVCDMKDTMSDSEESLLFLFVELTGIENNSADFPAFYLCDVCEEKLKSWYAFLKQCRKSNEMLHRYVFIEQVPDVKEEANTVEIIIEENCTKSTVVRNRPMRLKKIPFDEVSEALKETDRVFEENIECKKCGFVGSNSRALSLHISYIHTELKDRWCVHCNAEFENLPKHAMLHDHLKCQFCNKIFQNKGHLKEHLLSHSGHKPYKCETCKKGFLAQRHLHVHSHIHSHNKPFACHLCKQSFSQNVALKLHLTKHKKGVVPSNEDAANKDCELRHNLCTICNKNVRSLKQHMRAHLEKQTSIVDNNLCSVCGKQFRSTAKLKTHMRVHTGEVPYKCAVCPKRFTTRGHLVVHVRTHTGEKPHVCHVCGKNFAQSSVLNTHMKIHTGRPETCKLCSQKFCLPAQLRLHMRKHTGEKPYVCTECEQSFIQRSHLTEHQKTHSGDRPYECKYCDKSFKQSSTLKTHLNIHLGKKPYKCDVCSYACRQSYSLLIHKKKHAISADHKYLGEIVKV